MSTDTYKGESPAKKIARLQYWSSVIPVFGLDAFKKGKHLVLSSREGGDISVLLGFGVPPKNIIAVEMNVEAARQAQEKFPEVEIIQDDVFAVARRHHRGLSSAFFDFCSPISDALLKKVIGTCAYGIKDNGVLGCGFLAGRERGEISGLVESEKEDASALEDAILSQSNEEMLERLQLFPEIHGPNGEVVAKVNLAAAFERDPDQYRKFLAGLCRDTLSLRARATFLSSELVSRGLPLRCVPMGVAYIYYMSSTNQSKGVPMLYYAGKVLRGSPGHSVEKLRRRAMAFMDTMPEPMMMPLPPISEEDLPVHAVIMARNLPMKYMGRLLNVPQSTITAWSAHLTRGTYDDRIVQVQAEMEAYRKMVGAEI